MSATLSFTAYGELTARYDDVYLRWEAHAEQAAALRRRLNSLPFGETEDAHDLARLGEHTEQARALRTQLADLVLARQLCFGTALTPASEAA